MATQRNIAIDIMKGVTILLMLIGHTKGMNPLIYRYIFAFHMPLFFILSGRFYRPNTTFIADFKRLIVPVIFCLITMFFLWEIQEPLNYHHITRIIKGFFWSTASPHLSPNAIQISAIGPLWFLISMFWCKRIFHLMHIKLRDSWYLLIGVIVIFVGACLIHNYVCYLPLGILQGSTAVLFYYIGFQSNKIHKDKIAIAIATILVLSYLITPHFLDFNMDEMRYGLWSPLKVTSAIGGTILCYLICSSISKIPYLRQFLCWLGQNTLLLLIIHQLEMKACVTDVTSNILSTIVSALLVLMTVRFTPLNRIIEKIV